MKKDYMKRVVFTFILMLISIIYSNKAYAEVSTDIINYSGASSVRSGYNCYYLSANGGSTRKFLFYTNRSISSFPYSISTSGANLFKPNNNGDTIYSMYDRSDTYYSTAVTQDFEDYRQDPNSFQMPTNVSLEMCAAAGNVLYEETHEAVPLVYELSSGNNAVYDLFNYSNDSSNINHTILLYGKGFTVFEPVEGSEGDSLYNNGSYSATQPNISSLYSQFNINLSHCYDDISNQNDFLLCFGCNRSGEIDRACTTNIYTIGILDEPDTVTDVTSGNRGSNNSSDEDIVYRTDGSVLGGTAYNITCDDVKYVTLAYNIVRVLAPFLLIVFGSLDYMKAISAPDTKAQSDAKKKVPLRVTALILLIILPGLVGLVFENLGQYNAENLSVLCCVATGGNNQACHVDTTPIPSGNNGSSTNNGGSNSGAAVTEANMAGGSNYVSPTTTTQNNTDISRCINDYFGECSNVNVNQRTCTCKYTYRSNITQAVCNSDGCSVGYKSGKCFYHARIGESATTLSGINVAKQCDKNPQSSGSSGGSFDRFYQYNYSVQNNVTRSNCVSYLIGTPYCTTDDNCICIIGNTIY